MKSLQVYPSKVLLFYLKQQKNFSS